MPYKDKATRNAKARERRANDPHYAKKAREYHRKYSSKWRLENLDEQRAYQAKWYRDKRREIRGDMFGKRKPRKTAAEKLATERAKRKRFYHRHKNAINLRRKWDRAANPEKHHKIEARRWRENKVSRTMQNFIQRAKRYGVELYCTKEQWLALLAKFNFKCFYCNIQLTAKSRTLDHKIPLSRGGDNEPGNLVPACRRCNQRKHSMTAEEFMLLTTG